MPSPAVEVAGETHQSTVTTETVTVTKRKVIVFKGTITRTRSGGPVAEQGPAGARAMTGGVRLRIQSTVLEDFCREMTEPGIAPLSHRSLTRTDGSRLEAYRLTMEGQRKLETMRSASMIGAVKFQSWQENISLTAGEGTMNLSLIRCVGLGAGVDVTLPTVHTRAVMKDWMEKANVLAQYIYREHQKPYAFKITTTSEELA